MSSSPANSTDPRGLDSPGRSDDSVAAQAFPDLGSGCGEGSWTDGQSREINPGDQLSTSSPQDSSISDGGTPPGMASEGDLRVLPQCGVAAGGSEPITPPIDNLPAHSSSAALSDRQVTRDRLRGVSGWRSSPTPFIRRLHRCWGNARRANGASTEPPLIPNRLWMTNLNRGEEPCCQGNDLAAWRRSGHLILCFYCETLGTPNDGEPCVEHPSILVHDVNYEGAFEPIYWAQFVDEGEIVYRFHYTVLPSNHGQPGQLVACGQGIPRCLDGHWTIKLQSLFLPDGFIDNLRLFTKVLYERWTTMAQIPYPLKDSIWVCGERGLMGTSLSCDPECQNHHVEMTPAMYSTLLGDYDSIIYLDEQQRLQVDFFYPHLEGGDYQARPPYHDFIIQSRGGMPQGKWSKEIASLPVLSDCIEKGIERNIRAMELLTIMRHALNSSHEAHWEEAFYTVQSHLSQSIDTTLSQTAFAAQLDSGLMDPKGVEPMDPSRMAGGVEPPLSPSLLDPPPRPQNAGLDSEAEALSTVPVPMESASMAQQCSSSIQTVSSTTLDPSDLRSPSPPITRPKNKLQLLRDLLTRPQTASAASRRARNSKDMSQAVEVPLTSTPTKSSMPLPGDLEMSTISETPLRDQLGDTQHDETQQ